MGTRPGGGWRGRRISLSTDWRDFGGNTAESRPLCSSRRAGPVKFEGKFISSSGLPSYEDHEHDVRKWPDSDLPARPLFRRSWGRSRHQSARFLCWSLSLTVSRVEVSGWRVWAGATGTSRCASDESDDQAPAQGGDRVRNVTLGSDRWRLWVGNRRESQVARARAAARGAEGGIVSRSEIRNP